jgi:N-acetylornithine carbamoyltransferase
MKNWICPEHELSPEKYSALVDFALNLKSMNWEDKESLLKNDAVYFMFFNQSLRTRSSFHTGLAKLGGIPVALDPYNGIYTPALPGREIPYATERVSDVARVLSEFGQAIAIRMYGEPAGWVYGDANKYIAEFAEWAKIPVINMECDMYHPCQALADMMTIREKFGNARKKVVISWAYSGSWHKPLAVPQSALLASANCNYDLVLAYPKGFELDPEIVKAAKAKCESLGNTLTICNDFRSAMIGADVIYAKSWCSRDFLPKEFGLAVDEESMTALFEKNKDWLVDQEILSIANPDAIYMHCLPADRGQEVTDSVIDGPQSSVFAQAGNRMHAQNAAMVKLMNPAALVE